MEERVKVGRELPLLAVDGGLGHSQQSMMGTTRCGPLANWLAALIFLYILPPATPLPHPNLSIPNKLYRCDRIKFHIHNVRTLASSQRQGNELLKG